MIDRNAISVRRHVVALCVLCASLSVAAHATGLTSTPVESATPTPVTPTPTPTCAPTGTPYCSDNCVPCPTIRPFCYTSTCGSCIQNPTCASDAVCVPANNWDINGCCTCATVTPTPTPTSTPTCAPTGTPYCSNNCVPCPTVRPSCYVSACGWCIANPVCTSNEACLPSYDPNINGCCSCATVTPTPSDATTPTVTPTPSPCTGDCHDDSQVSVDEILMMVDITLGNADVATCTAGDANHDQQITVDEILTAVNNALNGCVQRP